MAETAEIMIGLKLAISNSPRIISRAKMEPAMGALKVAPMAAAAPVAAPVEEAVTAEQFETRYADVFTGPDEWQAIDVETRVFARFDDTFEGLLTVYAGVGTAWLFYHEEWDGEFEGGDEEEKMEFDYREQNLVFGSVGMRAERGPVVVEVGARYGGSADPQSHP